MFIKTQITVDKISIKMILPLPKKLTKYAIRGRDIFPWDTFDIAYLIESKMLREFIFATI